MREYRWMEAFKNQVPYIDIKQKISEAKPEEGPLFFQMVYFV